MNNSKESRLVKRAIKKYKWDILKVWTLKILFLITSLSSMYISGLYINVLVTGVNWNLILKYMLVLAGLIIWEIMFNYWNVMRYYQTQANLVFYINYYVLKHIKRIRLSFFDDKDPAYLNQRVNEDINSIVNYKLDLICNMSISVLSFITIIGILSRVEWKLAVITILSIPLYLLLYFYNDKKLCSATFEYKERQNMFFACMNRQLSRPRLVKIKSLFETLDQELKNEYPSFFNALYRYYKCNYVFSSMIEVLGKGYNIFLFIYCAVGIYNKSITIGEFVIIKNYYTMLLQASTQIIAILKTYPNMLVSKKRLNEILNIPSENNGNTLLKKIDSVKLEDFSFSYNSKKIFEHFNYEFHKGNIYLIKGKNGVGKTTLINNILGLYIESYGGDILYNNYSIKELNLYEMRKNLISITEQEPVLFYQGNILKNIENNSNAAAMRLIKNFGLKDIGVEQCAGGEKQKISIINSLLKNGELLILDEPSSALDKNSTIYLQKELVKLKSQKIIIIISHDLQMDKIADKILDLDDKNNEEII